MNMRMMEVAHDMKMPLQLICSCAQMLEMEVEDSSNAAQYVKMLAESARDLRELVLSALDGGYALEDAPQWESRDIVEETRRIARHFSLPAREKGVTLSFSANARSFRMRTDAAKLRRMLENLIANALAATPAGGRIEICVAVRGDAVELIVTDTGCGIPSRHLPRVMQPGFTTGGHGLGLSIVEKYARMLGGCVYVASEEQHGSSFTIHLPVKTEKISV